MTLHLPVMCFTCNFFVGKFLTRHSQKPLVHPLKLDSLLISHTHRLQINPHTYREMIKEITIKFGTELKPTQDSWKSQPYSFDEPVVAWYKTLAT